MTDRQTDASERITTPHLGAAVKLLLLVCV